jgi:hypothetical protein
MQIHEVTINYQEVKGKPQVETRDTLVDSGPVVLNYPRGQQLFLDNSLTFYRVRFRETPDSPLITKNSLPGWGNDWKNFSFDFAAIDPQKKVSVIIFRDRQLPISQTTPKS